MTPTATIPDRISPSTPGSPVWETIWARERTAEEDDTLLQRERDGERWQRARDVIATSFGSIEDLRSVELGSGRGDFSVMLAEKGAAVTLVDTNAAALSSARRRFDRLGLSADTKQDDLFAFARGFGGGTAGAFDVAVSLGVIEHFDGAARTLALKAHLDLLRPGGLAIVSVPHAWSWPYRLWKRRLETANAWPYGFEKPFSRRELIARAGEAGFARCECFTFGFRQFVSDRMHERLGRAKPRVAVGLSALDRWFGAAIVLFAWRSGTWSRAGG